MLSKVLAVGTTAMILRKVNLVSRVQCFSSAPTVPWNKPFFL